MDEVDYLLTPPLQFFNGSVIERVADFDFNDKDRSVI